MPPSPLARLRRLALALPESHEVEAWGEPTFRVRGKIFAMFAAKSSHHGDERPGVWVKAMAENQRIMVRAEPHRYFVPPYVGPSGWIGVFLDGEPDWEELTALLEDAWRRTARKKTIAAFDAGATGRASPAKAAPAKATAKTATPKKAAPKKAAPKKVASSKPAPKTATASSAKRKTAARARRR